MRGHGARKLQAVGVLFGMFLLLDQAAAVPRDGGAEADGGPHPVAAPVARPAPPPDAGSSPLPDAGAAPSGGSTGGATPPAVEGQDVFSLAHRCILPDEELLIRIDHRTKKAIRIKQIDLYYPRDADPRRSDAASPSGAELQGVLHLMPYQSLDATGSILRIDLRRLRIETGGTEDPPRLPLWRWNYALWQNRPVSLLITYTLGEDKQEGEPRTVTLRPDISNRLRGIFWGVIGLLISVLTASSIGAILLHRRKAAEGEAPLTFGEKFWYVVLGVTLTPRNRFSLSSLQVVIWTHITAYSICYVWTLTGEMVQLTLQILLLLGIGGLTAVASRMTTPVLPSGLSALLAENRVPKLRDLVSNTDTPSIFKFQMLIFTLISGGIVAWEVTRAYVFPVLPNELVGLMGLSNATFLLGNAAVSTPENSAVQQLNETLTEIDKRIAEWNAGLAPEERSKRLSRELLVQRFLAARDLLTPELAALVTQVQSHIERIFA